MNAVLDIHPPQATAVRASLGQGFSDLVNEMATRLAQASSLKEELLSTAEYMGQILNILATNQISLSSEAIEKVRSNLIWMEGHLDGDPDSFLLASLQYARLRQAYQDISQALCMILIQSSFQAG